MKPMELMKVARAQGLAEAIAGCRDDARLDGVREGAAEIARLLAEVREASEKGLDVH